MNAIPSLASRSSVGVWKKLLGLPILVRLSLDDAQPILESIVERDEEETLWLHSLLLSAVRARGDPERSLATLERLERVRLEATGAGEEGQSSERTGYLREKAGLLIQLGRTEEVVAALRGTRDSVAVALADSFADPGHLRPQGERIGRLIR